MTNKPYFDKSFWGQCIELTGTKDEIRTKWIEANGPIPEKKFLYHICNNKACGNPKHALFVINETPIEITEKSGL